MQLVPAQGQQGQWREQHRWQQLLSDHTRSITALPKSMLHFETLRGLSLLFIIYFTFKWAVFCFPAAEELLTSSSIFQRKSLTFTLLHCGQLFLSYAGTCTSVGKSRVDKISTTETWITPSAILQKPLDSCALQATNSPKFCFSPRGRETKCKG